MYILLLPFLLFLLKSFIYISIQYIDLVTIYILVFLRVKLHLVINYLYERSLISKLLYCIIYMYLPKTSRVANMLLCSVTF